MGSVGVAAQERDNVLELFKGGVLELHVLWQLQLPLKGEPVASPEHEVIFVMVVCRLPNLCKEVRCDVTQFWHNSLVLC